MNDMETYTPKVLRKKKDENQREEMYAVGTEMREGTYSMWEGPSPTVDEMLETVGTGGSDVIIRYNPDYTEDVIWRWSRNKWIKVVPPAISVRLHGAVGSLRSVKSDEKNKTT